MKVSISQQTVSYQLKNSEKILSSDAREPTSHMRIQNQIRYDFEKDLIVELEELYRLTNITQQLAKEAAKRLQKSPKYRSSEEIQKMEFGRKWCRKYSGSAKFKYKAEKGSKKYIEEIELENEKTRLRYLVKNYKPEDVFNMAKVQLKKSYF